MQRVWVQSLVRELRSQALASPDHKTKTQNRSNIVTNSVKTFKWSTSKILKKKKKGEKEALEFPCLPPSTFCRMTREKDVQFPSCPPLSKGWMWVEGGGLAADGAVALALWQVNHLRMVGLLSLEWDIFEWFPM